MSLLQDLDMHTDDTVFLTSDENVVMSMINPKFKSHQQKNLEDIFDMNQDAFESSASKDPFILNNAPIQGRVPEEGNKEAKGGFAIAALAPFIPLIAPLIGPAINGLISLFRKKAGSMNPPNLRFGRGGSMNPPNYQGAGIKEYLQERLPALQQQEAKLKGLSGSEFWKEAMNITRNEVSNIVQLLQGEGYNLPNASRIVEAVVKRTIPKSFASLISKGHKFNLDTAGQSQLGTIIKPMTKWAIYKSLDKNTAPNERKSITSQLKNIDSLIGQEASGGAITWDRIRTVAKNVLAKILPKVAPILKQVAQQMIDRIPNMTQMLMQRAGVENPQMMDFVGQAAQTVGREAVNQAFNSLGNVGSGKARGQKKTRTTRKKPTGGGRKKATEQPHYTLKLL